MSEVPSDWDADTVRELRGRLGLTQAELAEQIGTRQQTISEWETGISRPRRMSQRLLRMVAESSSAYESDGSSESDRHESHPPGLPASAPSEMGSSGTKSSGGQSSDGQTSDSQPSDAER